MSRKGVQYLLLFLLLFLLLDRWMQESHET
jgi:hypothetical protein